MDLSGGLQTVPPKARRPGLWASGSVCPAAVQADRKLLSECVTFQQTFIYPNRQQADLARRRQFADPWTRVWRRWVYFKKRQVFDVHFNEGADREA